MARTPPPSTATCMALERVRAARPRARAGQKVETTACTVTRTAATPGISLASRETLTTRACPQAMKPV